MPPDESHVAQRDPAFRFPVAGANQIPAYGWIRNTELFRARELGLSRCQTLQNLSQVGTLTNA